jgi:cellulose synthase/poly-beta-1,6-N-acetylglucosamine synthase-like glycosyltransferase
LPGTNDTAGDGLIVVLFTDADCVPVPDWIEQMIAPLVDRCAAGVKGAYRTRQAGLLPRFVQLEYQDKYDRMVGQDGIDFVDTYSAGYRQSVLLEEGGFDESFPGAAVEDIDLSSRLREGAATRHAGRSGSAASAVGACPGAGAGAGVWNGAPCAGTGGGPRHAGASNSTESPCGNRGRPS